METIKMASYGSVVLQAKVRVYALGLRPRLNAGPCLWRTALLRWHMQLAALYKFWSFTF